MHLIKIKEHRYKIKKNFKQEKIFKILKLMHLIQ